MKSTKSDNLQRWLGEQGVNGVSLAMRGWYGPPIAVSGVPGNVYACGDGDFVGECRAGYETTAEDYVREATRRLNRAVRRATRAQSTLHAGFASLADLIIEGKAGKKQTLRFVEKPISGVNGASVACWRSAGSPPAGAAGAAAPGGTAFDSSSTGAFPLANPLSGDRTFVGRSIASSPGNGTILLHDRLFSVAKTMSSTTTEAVTGVPTRYTSTTPGAADYAAGNFAYVECTTNLSAGAHNWTVCQYTDQDGNAGASFPSFAGITTQVSPRFDMPVNSWFIPLAAGDTGVSAITQMQCDTSLTGGIDFTLAHPLAWMPLPTATLLNVADGIASSFNLSRVFDNACLALLFNNGGGATSISGSVELISG